MEVSVDRVTSFRDLRSYYPTIHSEKDGVIEYGFTTLRESPSLVFP